MLVYDLSLEPEWQRKVVIESEVIRVETSTAKYLIQEDDNNNLTIILTVPTNTPLNIQPLAINSITLIPRK